MDNMKKHTLAVNMHRFKTKNLHEQPQGNFHPNADNKAYDAIIDILAEMSDLDHETVQNALEDVSSDDPTFDDPKYYERITEKIIPMLQSIANGISEKFNYYNQ